VARLVNSPGAIVAVKPVSLFNIVFITSATLPLIQTYSDGDVMVGGCIQMTPFIANVNMQILVWSGGATFENGTSQYLFNSNDMDVNHQYDYYLITGAPSHFCHSVYVVQ
jgi:hypothetical protein